MTKNTDDAAIGTLLRFHMDAYAVLCIRNLADLGVADALSDESASASELAAKVSANSDALHRVLRLTAAYGVFIEEADGRFRHSPLSRLLRTDHPRSQRAWFRLGVTELSMAVSAAMGHTLRTGLRAAEVAAPAGMFSYLAAHPAEALIFNEAMTSKTHANIAEVLEVYDFSAFSSIADIGGGHGHLLTAVLNSAPNATGVLFDLPQTLSMASHLANERLTLQAGDFFKDPLPACDAYLLMNVIHDWSDEQAIAILSTVRRAAPPHAFLLLLEAELPSGPGPHVAKYLDVVMLGWSTGRERTAAQYEKLLTAAGFSLRRILPASSHLSLFEAVVA